MALRQCLKRLQQSAPTQLASVGAARTYAANALAEPEPGLWRSSAAVLHGVNDLRFEDVAMPERVADGSCRVEMKAVGICGSDVHFWKKVHLDRGRKGLKSIFAGYSCAFGRHDLAKRRDSPLRQHVALTFEVANCRGD